MRDSRGIVNIMNIDNSIHAALKKLVEMKAQYNMADQRLIDGEIINPIDYLGNDGKHHRRPLLKQDL